MVLEGGFPGDTGLPSPTRQEIMTEMLVFTYSHRGAMHLSFTL